MSDSCLFCQIAGRKIPSAVEFEDEDVLAFRDINPQAPVHILVIPKRHISDINSLAEGDFSLIGKLFDAARKIAKSKSVDDGYRLVVNNGRKAGQSVFHVHVHILGGRTMNWPPG